MTLAEMKAASDQLSRINSLAERLKEKRQVLDLVNKYGKTGQVWQPELTVWRAPQYSGSRDIVVRVAIPFGVIQQQAVYEVEAAKRELIKAGGQP